MDYCEYVNHNKQKTEIVYYHRGSSESSSEGMSNDSNSCWMISVIQALRGSEVFRREFAPKAHESNALKKELFKLFDVAEGKSGHKRRAVKPEEIRNYKKLVIKAGLPVKINSGYIEKPFLDFLLTNFQAKPITYYNRSKKKQKNILSIRIKESHKNRTLQDVISAQKIRLEQKPHFLPIYLSRAYMSQVPVTPAYTLQIPYGRDGKKAIYSLSSIIIGRDSIEHAYSYVLEKSKSGSLAWVEYNDSKVVVHKEPLTKKRTKNSKKTPFEDAVKNGEIMVYELVSD